MTTTEYAGNYIYENSVLKFFSHPEGYVEPNGVSYEYVYQYRAERLKNVQWTFLANEPAGARRGNIRLSYSDPNDSYQDILDSDLTNSYNGWVHNGAVTSELTNGTLKVDVNSAYEGIRNELPNLTVSPGDVLDITLVFDKGNTLSNVRLYFQELDANGNHLSWNTMDANLQTGTHSYTYTVNAANRLTLRIDKDNTNTSSLTSFYVDHVSVTTGALEILEENNYYPFGLKHKGYNDVVSANSNSVASKFKYNGMELEESLGVDWYEMDLRQYDPAIARWTAIDPVTHFSKSTYSAFDNNPIYYADPSGADSNDYNAEIHRQRFVEGNGAFDTYDGGMAVANNNKNKNNTNESVGQCDDCSKCPETCNEKKSKQSGAPVLAPPPPPPFRVIPGGGGAVGTGIKSMLFRALTMATALGSMALLEGDSAAEPSPYDPSDEDHANIYVYRAMKTDSDGLPSLGESGSKLGVRTQFHPTAQVVDIRVDSNGRVNFRPSEGNGHVPGMSANLNPTSVMGRGLTVFKIKIQHIPLGLIAVNDHGAHVSIAPASNMLYSSYKALLEITRPLWTQHVTKK
ncbi:RHS repeat-associated core domain-containing protein [uncultured Psychroserpens sp.]|uniref:RHS repeat domain-containing protein n=1 Tax=uncultured Psychroserpens sp. TaxID=255436 RepID=UPI002639F106|nr:RHS repeat-associated core domain-containing protein [uncultured Psychroserpens sp.]